MENNNNNNNLLGWMAEHPFLTFFLVVAVFEGTAKVIVAARENSNNKKGDKENEIRI